MKKISKRQLWEYIILVARFWLAFILIVYSTLKLTGFQFYINPHLLATKVKNANLFQLSWFLADHSPFKYFIGFSEITAALLLIFNRTAIIGALMVIPIWLNILIWDISFIDKVMAIQFACRIGYYLVLTGLILWFYKDKIIIAYKSLSEKINSHLNKSVLLYLSLLIVGYALEFIVGKLVTYSGYLYYLLSHL